MPEYKWRLMEDGSSILSYADLLTKICRKNFFQSNILRDLVIYHLNYTT
jgi:hypothetical protein